MVPKFTNFEGKLRTEQTRCFDQHFPNFIKKTFLFCFSTIWLRRLFTFLSFYLTPNVPNVGIIYVIINIMIYEKKKIQNHALGPKNIG